MKKHGQLCVVAGVAALLSTTALAAVSNIKEMENGSQISITGTVESVKNEREFKLRDSTGTINVDIESNESVVLKQGDSVTVSGKVDKGLLKTDINANTVKVNKNIAQAVGDAIEGRTGVSLEGATPYDINKLPKEGLVKVSGTVTDVDNEKEFTLKDATGAINVDVESAEKAAITKGAEVTVIGYVDKSMFGKDINASRVLVTADATMANQ